MATAKVAVIGAGAVGAATTLALTERGVAREIVLIDTNADRARAVALDMHYGAPLVPAVSIRAADYDDLPGTQLVIITAGVNEAAGGATNRADPQGRLRLLQVNATAYRDIIPKVMATAPGATLMVVTDPPDPLADLSRALAKHDRVFSTGTVVDSLRFRVHLAEHLRVCAADVQAQVVGEHGTSEVPLWSSASVAGVPVLDLLDSQGQPTAEIRARVETEIRNANINIIEGIGASQYGIGMVSARLAEAVLRDERAIYTVAAYNTDYGVTLSLPGVLGRNGVQETHQPRMNQEEHAALQRSAETLRQAVTQVV